MRSEQSTSLLMVAAVLCFLTGLLFTTFLRSAISTLVAITVLFIWEIRAGRIRFALTRKSKSQKLVKWLRQDYDEIRSKNPGQEVHWYLANVWLTHYHYASMADEYYLITPNQSLSQVRKERPEKLPSYAFLETHQFSILDSEDAIAALSYFLVYKEMREQAHQFESEFARCMKSILESQADGTFWELYIQRNRNTYESIVRGELGGPNLNITFAMLKEGICDIGVGTAR